jgi:pimeloyl-ACP methyl ester carboxylesterase
MDATVGGHLAQPTTLYAQAGNVNIAYQVIGDGPVDLVWAWGLASNIEVVWEEPSYAAFLRRLSQFARVILFDRRGCGISDREGTAVTPTLEERMDDVIAVLDAVGSETASILGVSEGGCLAAALAATHPHRVSSIILYGTVAHFRQDSDHPWELAGKGTLADFAEWMRRGWGTTGRGERSSAVGAEHGRRPEIHRLAGQALSAVGEPRRDPAADVVERVRVSRRCVARRSGADAGAAPSRRPPGAGRPRPSCRRVDPRRSFRRALGR